ELKRSLLPLFGDAAGLDVFFDTSEVPAMQEDEDKRTERWNKMLQSGAITVYEYRVGLGLEADDSHKYYLRGISMIEVAIDGQARAQLPEPAKGARGAKHDGHDHASGEHGRRASEDAYRRGARFALILQRQ